MTRRAALMLAALQDGCQARHEIYGHAGKFFLTNNAASDLRRAGVNVAYDHATDSYHLLVERFGCEPAPLVEETSGQMAIGEEA